MFLMHEIVQLMTVEEQLIPLENLKIIKEMLSGYVFAVGMNNRFTLIGSNPIDLYKKLPESSELSKFHFYPLFWTKGCGGLLFLNSIPNDIMPVYSKSKFMASFYESQLKVAVTFLQKFQNNKDLIEDPQLGTREVYENYYEVSLPTNQTRLPILFLSGNTLAGDFISIPPEKLYGLMEQNNYLDQNPSL
jgi:hypothetical protein